MLSFSLLSRLVFFLLMTAWIVGCGGGNKQNNGPKPIISLSLERQTIYDNESTKLIWSVENATSVVINNDIGHVALTGNKAVTAKETTTYTVKATGDGGVAEKSMTLNITPYLAAELRANIVTGFAPLTVNFAPILKTQNAINRHYWDFEGNGGDIDGGLGSGEKGFDPVVSLLSNRLIDYDVVGRNYSFTYTKPGTYTVRLRVWDADDLQEEATLNIEVLNQPPVITASTDKDNGEIPLTVTFLVVATDNEGIATYEWDFDNNDVYEESTTAASIQHVYQTVGDFQARVRVTDTLGVATQIAVPHIEIRARPEGSPSLSLSASPLEGKAPLTVSFSSSTSVPDGSSIAKREWDFKGDGTFQKITETSTNFEYLSGGRYYPRLKVTTENGDVAETVVEIQVNAQHELIIVQNTINPETNREEPQVFNTSTIQTKLGGDGSITLYVENRNRQVVRTLVPFADRVTGDYEDIWDGKDDAGNILPPGDYYIVLKYTVAGEEKILDLRDMSGGEIFYPAAGGCSRYGISPCGKLTVPTNDPLEPFAGKPWIFTYDMPHVANMTSYMTIYTTNKVVNTFFQQVLQGAGVYKIVWNGEGTDGKILQKTRTKYLISLFGHTLADNVIFLDHRARIANFSITPSIYFPTNKIGEQDVDSTLKFDLDKNADIEMYISSAKTGGEVMRKTFSRVSAGEGIELTWNGRNSENILLAPGPYRISIQTKFSSGSDSVPIHAMQRIQY